jgi:hypothetical protein
MALSVAMPEGAPGSTHLVPLGSPQAQCGILTWEAVTVVVKDKAGHERQILKKTQARRITRVETCAAVSHACIWHARGWRRRASCSPSWVRGWRCVGVHLCCATDASRTRRAFRLRQEVRTPTKHRASTLMPYGAVALRR